MANNVKNISTVKPSVQGAIWIGGAEAAVPTTATGELTGFECLGTVSEDGVKKKISRDSESVKDWGGNTVTTIQKDYEATYEFTMIEILNENVLKTYYGEDNVTVAGNKMTIKGSSAELPQRPWVIDTVLNDGRKCREVIPCGKISNTGDIEYKRDEAMGYGVTVTALPDAEGRPFYMYYE
nr:phage tail protein [uncultured Mogibacterium sp.]